MTWRAWVLGTFWLLFFVQIPGLSLEHSQRLVVCASAVIALVISATTTPIRRTKAFGLSVVVVGVCLMEALRLSKSAGDYPWLFTWGAWCDVAGWTVLVLAASLAYMRGAMRWRIEPWLFGILLINIPFALLDKFGLFSRWLFGPGNPGLFPTDNAWAAWCVISAPILYAWSPAAALPAVFGVVLSSSSSALLILFVWAAIKEKRFFWYALVLIALVLVKEPDLLIAIKYRVNTWIAVLQTILANPGGIGWGFESYAEVAKHATERILPHPCSDWLLWPLRYGWWVIPVFVGSTIWLWGKNGPVSDSLKVAWALAAIQSSVSVPIVGALVWVLYLMSRVEGDT